MEKSEQDRLREEVDEVLHGSKGAAQPPQVEEQNACSNVRHVIGVVSGKGGVGKSLVSGILAVNLARRGARVGILDADITGPSVPRMMGLAGERARAVDELLVPNRTTGGIKVMSANLVLEHESDPVLWRGPVVAGAIKQFWSECAWGELDYLLVDMPPGTGDVALTVFQSLPVDGVVIVSSPQDLVQMVVGKAVNMANLMQVPVLGLVENMAYVECPHCGERIYPYGPSRLAETAEAFDVEALGQLGIDPALAAACDDGTFERALPEGLLSEATDAVVATAEFVDAVRGGTGA